MEKGVREEKGAPDGGSLAVDSRIDGRGLAAAAGRQRWTSVEQQQKPVIRWERFLPKRSLRVLLVEYDDSTRHIVTALLRKCSYHVAPVADGLKAWEVMKEKEYKFDLVLTEIAMPSLSGFGLLTKIMGTELCRNIPVIMMSSHDSVGVVLKCMLKGAVDFLVKPVRKNELQNLWQHVWRKHCSSSFANVSENNAGSNHVRANAGNESTTGENSGEGRDTQSSGSKPEMEIESFPKQRSVSREVEQEQPDNGMALLVNASKMDDHEEARDKQVVIEANVAQPIQEAVLAERIKARKHSCIIPPHREEELGFLRSKGGDNFDPGSYRPKDATNQPSQDMINFIASIASGQCSYAVSEKDTLIKEFCEATKSSNIKNAPNFGSLPSGELSLRRPQPNGCVVPEFKDRHILIHSHASAFSRYNDRRTHHSCQESSSSSLCTRNRECSDRCYSHFSSPCTANEKNTSFAPNERLAFPQGKEAGATKYFQVSSNNNNNNEDAGLLSSGPPRENVGVACYSPGEGTDFCRPQPGIISLPIPVRAIPLHTLYAGYGAMLQPIFYTETSLSPHGLAALEKEKVLIPSDQSGHHNNHFIKDPQSTKFHRHEENRHSPMRQGMKDQPIAQGNPRALLWTPVDLANPCGSCSQGILKGSRSNGSGETTDAAMNTGTLPESGNESSVPNCNGIGFDCDRSHRETALIKFRLKRKDRCFEKKVRYHSRKKFAEQRPRVKGQFVRQTVLDFMIRKADD